jgi:hypothetical protein
MPKIYMLYWNQIFIWLSLSIEISKRSVAFAKAQQLFVFLHYLDHAVTIHRIHGEYDLYII